MRRETETEMMVGEKKKIARGKNERRDFIGYWSVTLETDDVCDKTFQVEM